MTTTVRLNSEGISGGRAGCCCHDEVSPLSVHWKNVRWLNVELNDPWESWSVVVVDEMSDTDRARARFACWKELLPLCQATPRFTTSQAWIPLGRRSPRGGGIRLRFWRTLASRLLERALQDPLVPLARCRIPAPFQ